MKNNIMSKIITFAAVSVLSFSALPFQTSACELTSADIESCEEEIIEITQQLSVKYYYSEDYDGYSYSSLLDQNNISVYNSLVSLSDPTEEPLKINLPEEVRVSLGSKNTEEALTDEEKNTISQQVADSVYSGYGFFLLDHPEFFWAAPTFTFSYTGTYEVNNLSNETVFKVNDVTLCFQLDEDFQGDIDYAKNCKEQLSREISEFPVEGETRYEKVKSIHDNLIQTVSYNKDAAFAHSVIGSLVYGESVCEGYSEAFKLICDRENIPCILVVNNGHMWNQVKMEDGNWYAIDVAWDDRDFVEELSGSEVAYDYFLKGMNNFIMTHMPISNLYGISYKTPSLNRKDYECPQQFFVSLKKEDSVPEENADLDGDGVVSIADAVICTATVLSFDSDTECDINNDGITNAFDIIALKKIIKASR